MTNMEITSISSRGQVVIPQKLRDKLKINEGEKFIVVGKDDTIILKKIKVSSFDDLLKKTREFAKNKKLKEGDISDAIKRVRKS